MKSTFKNFTISAVFHGDKVSPWGNNYNYNKVTVVNNDNGKKTSFDFWGSLVRPEIKTDEDAKEAFYCFVSDAVSYLSTGTLDSFFDEFGYNVISEGIKAFNGCEKAFKKLERLTGFSDDEIYSLLDELSE